MSEKSLFASHHFLLFPVGFRDELLFLASSILSTEVKRDEHGNKSHAKDNGPGENVFLSVLNCPEEETDEDSENSNNSAEDKKNIESDFLAVEGIVVIRDGFPLGVGLAESSLVLICVENCLSSVVG